MSNRNAETDVQFSLIEKSLSAEFLADFPNYIEGLVRGDPGGFVLTKDYADNADKYLNFPLRSDDVWVVTFPKCGNFDLVWLFFFLFLLESLYKLTHRNVLNPERSLQSVSC